jgi:hypothetical protein
MKCMPQSRLGLWTVWLNAVFLAVIIVSVILVKLLGVLRFEDTWWDVTATVFILPVISLITGILCLRKERSRLLIASVAFSALVIMFLLAHSLFIQD